MNGIELPMEAENRFTAEALQEYRMQEREIDDWKAKEEQELQEDYQFKLTEMRTEYHAKLEDIDKTYHQKDQALDKERQLLERDLLQAREDLTAYGDEIEESIEFGMVLPESISARPRHDHVPLGHPIM